MEPKTRPTPTDKNMAEAQQHYLKGQRQTVDAYNGQQVTMP